MESLNINSKITLSGGTKIPVIGLGVWKIPDGEEVENAATWALEAGYRHIDTAKIYGNEEGVGRAIKKSGVAREEIFVTTKLWNADQGYDTALKAIDGSLQRLQMDYVDLYLIHWPYANSLKIGNHRKETWRAMEQILKTGKAKAIGVSNYTLKHLREMQNYANIQPAVNQVEFHPFLYQQELLQYCKQNNIVLEAYSPLMHGNKMDDEKISGIAGNYGKTPAQVLIRWSLQHGNVVIPKSSHKQRIQENINVFNFQIGEQDMAVLDSLNKNEHMGWNPEPLFK